MARKGVSMDIHTRVVIEMRYCRDKRSVREIAGEVGYSHVAVLKELQGKPRKGGGRYDALRAQRETERRRQRRGRREVLSYPPLRDYVKEKLKEGWSPEQIGIRLPLEYPEEKKMRVSHESIYRWVFSSLQQEDLRRYLTRMRKKRLKRGCRVWRQREQEEILPSIEGMPVLSGVGHWQGDTVLSRRGDLHRVKSINEVVTGVVFFEKTKDGTAEACNEVLIERLNTIPPLYRKTLLQDRGSENRQWRPVQREAGIHCYFAHPYASYERGANENANGLLRRHFPKGTDFGKVKSEDIARVEYLLNTRPRKRLNGNTPYEVFYQRTGVDLEKLWYIRGGNLNV